MVAAVNRVRSREFPDLLTKLAGGGRFSTPKLCDCVFRELQNLFSTRLGPASDELERFPYVKVSALRYGVRDPSGPVGEPSDYADHLAQTIRMFEPRLEPSSVTVQPITSDHISAHRWVFRIDGTLSTGGNVDSFRCFAAFDLMEGRATVVR
jgi:predicted component of type VI protein secretion system